MKRKNTLNNYSETQCATVFLFNISFFSRFFSLAFHLLSLSHSFSHSLLNCFTVTLLYTAYVGVQASKRTCEHCIWFVYDVKANDSYLVLSIKRAKKKRWRWNILQATHKIDSDETACEQQLQARNFIWASFPNGPTLQIRIPLSIDFWPIPDGQGKLLC